ncbi:MAG: ATP-binding protein [Candidatus Thiodiazotropha sp. (ex. Lucinoma kazani)]
MSLGWKDNHVFKHKDGHLIPVSYTVSVMYEGELLAGVVLTFNDISERKQSAEERSRLERQLNQTHKMEAVGQLAGDIAREINTPIQYVGDNLRFLKEAFNDMGIVLQVYEKLLAEAEENETLLPQVETVRRAIEEADLDYLNEEAPKTIDQSIAGADQVARIVLAMKEFAHPGTKKRALADLNQIISNASAVCKNEWKYVANTELRLAEDLPQVNCTGGELSQVILNLIVNAAHAIEEAQRSEKGKITISSEVIGNQVEVRVTDTGVGIPKDVQEYVFNPFFTTKDVGGGTGQGLAIAQDIVVSKHHGELFFETEEGVGTTFTIRIPLEVKDA